MLPPGTPEARRGLALGQIVGGIFTTLGGVTGGVIGAVETSTGVGAVAGVPQMVVSAGLVAGGVGNIATGIRGLMTTGSGDGAGKIKVKISQSRYPETAAHVKAAQQAGKPAKLTIDRPGSGARRSESLKGTKRVSGMDRDEYPPAMFKEGGQGASVRPVTPGDNRGAGACVGAQCRDLSDGTVVDITVIP